MSNEPQRGHQDRIPDHEEVVIGKVVSVNVPRRELRIAPDTSHPERFLLLRQLRLKTKEKQTLILPLVSVRVTIKGAIATIEGDAGQVAAARGATVVVNRSQRFPLPQHEYYIDDLIGLVVKDSRGNIVGRLAQVWHTPANDIYQVLDEQGRETLVPAVETFIISVDIERGEMIADTDSLE